jgi:hypothetical protein
MPGSLYSLLGSIPWSTLLRQAPALVKAAETLLSGALLRRETKQNAGAVESLKDRVAALEAHDREDAELVKRMAQELEMLTFTTRIVASRTKAALGISFAGLVLGAIAVVLVFQYKN